jgi:hypothetical protein
MTLSDWFQLFGLIAVGLLAGTEYVVRWGVQPALSSLDDASHLPARQALVRSLRGLVPALMIPAVLLNLVALASGGSGAGFGFRIATLAALVGFVLLAFLGTVPINIAVIEWDAENPPAGWREVIRRWERIDSFRSSAAIIAFVCAAIALTQRAMAG